MARDPISKAIAGLIEASGLDFQFWGDFLNCPPEKVEEWCQEDSEAIPTDVQMTALVHELEWKKDGQGWPKVPAALDEFWRALAEWEGNHNQSTILYPLQAGETSSMRVLRFTNAEHLEGIYRNMHLIPPRRRQQFLDELTMTFNKYVSV